jgi:monomeric sarcosine oxidase
VKQEQIIIVGAGIIGLSTAYALLKQGMKHVTVFEQAAVDHQRGTSSGLSRLLRFEYGADLFYSEMVKLSLERWQMLERLSGQSLYTPTGLLVLGNEDDSFTRASHRLLQHMGLPIERLSRQHCTVHFPQFNTQSYNFLTYNPNAGMLHASTCLQTLKRLVVDLGGHIYEKSCVTHMTHDRQHQPIRLHLTGDGEQMADRVVLATGPWVHKLLAELCLPIRITRQHLLYFANLPPSSFALHAFPAFMAGDLYGFPIHNTCVGSGPSWLKVASHIFGSPIDPDEIPVADNSMIMRITEKLSTILPALQKAVLAHVDVCMYDVSLDEDFIVDHHPADSRIVFATGLTGHGFKFGPVLGELLSSLLCDTDPVVPLDRFRLARFTHPIATRTGSAA